MSATKNAISWLRGVFQPGGLLELPTRVEINEKTTLLVALLVGFQAIVVQLATTTSPASTPAYGNPSSITAGVTAILYFATGILVFLAIIWVWRRYFTGVRSWLKRVIKYAIPVLALELIILDIVILDVPASMYIAIGALALLATALWASRHLDVYWALHDTAAVALGIFATLGLARMLAPSNVALILVVLLVYDHLAVNHSQVMQSLISGSVAARLPNYLVIPTTPRFDMHELETFLTNPDSEDRPEQLGMLIGLGDFIMPALLAASVTIHTPHAWTLLGYPLAALAVITGTTIGAIWLHSLINTTTQAARPALPYLTTPALAAYALATAAVILTGVVA